MGLRLWFLFDLVVMYYCLIFFSIRLSPVLRECRWLRSFRDFYHIYGLQHHLKRREVRDVRAAYTRNLFINKDTSDSGAILSLWLLPKLVFRSGYKSKTLFQILFFSFSRLTLFFVCLWPVVLQWGITFSRYTRFGTKLSPIFGFAKSFQIQNQLPIKPIAQIRCSSC